MRYVDFVGRLAGLAVVVAGAALAGRRLLVAPPDGPGIGVVGPASVTLAVAGTTAIGGAFVIAGLAVLVGRGRSLAVSIGGVLATAAAVGLAVGIGSPGGVLGVGAVALALLLSGASTGVRSTE